MAGSAKDVMKHQALPNLQAFVSDNAQRIYGVTPPAKSVTLAATPFKVPQMYDNVIPLFANQEISWSIVQIS
ncbi:MAG: hypothetical protein AAGF83_21760 [Cyanobacteria bacterium P01_G01_bin.67]